jgi:NAD+ diphosphatase
MRFAFQGETLWWFEGPGPALPEAVLQLPEGHSVHRVAPAVPPPPGVQPLGLREAHGLVPAEVWAAAGRAYQWLVWSEEHRFCGACAAALLPGEGRGLRCPACGLQVFPGHAVAMIVLIRRGAELLLSRSPHFRPGVYSAQAGFTEPGESLEQCVHREVSEELGIRIRGLRYFGSQPWPFPNGLMVAFTADYADGTLRPDPGELEDARWFHLDALPLLPSPLSIARRLLDAAIEEHQKARS